MSINRQIGATLLLLIATILLFAYTPLDFWVQDLFFNQESHTWLLHKNDEPYRFILYDGVKKLLIVVAVFFLFSLLFFRRVQWVKEYKKGLLVVVFSAILIPVIVGGLKKETNMPCPKNEMHYGGEYPTTKVWESYPKSFQQKRHIRCWPAGHASGGFALMSLFFFFKSRRNRFRALALALLVAWSMGIYKMMIGDHFLSHTIITMLIAWLTILSLVRIFKRDKDAIPSL